MTTPEEQIDMPEDNVTNVTPSEQDDAGEQVLQYLVRRRIAGRRLDKYLQHLHPRISRTAIQKYIKQGDVTVNGMPSKASYEPAGDDLIEIRLPPPPPTRLIPENIPLEIVYEDDWMMVINKAAGIICHPANATQSGTIANAAAYHAKQLSKGGDAFRPGIVHRLDKNTTGIMLIAKCDEAHWRISLQFERRTIKKQYFAVCWGDIKLDGDLINKPLAPHPETTQRMVLPSAMPPRQAMFKEAVTQYRVNTRYRGFTSVDLFPKTGRTHQLRIHMASIGHPMVGDKLYGGNLVSEFDLNGKGSTDPLFDFQALHARRISLIHPILEKQVEFEAPLPEHLLKLCDLLEARQQRSS